MKKRLLTGTLVASSAALLVYTAFYNKGVDVGLAQKHRVAEAEFKKYNSTTKQNQVDAFTRLIQNHPVADADNTVAANPIAAPVEQAKQQQSLAANISYKQYSIASNSAMRIVNAETGTAVNIKPNTFVNEFGEVAEGNIHLSVREMHTAPQFFLGNLPMNGYESRGVIELNATADNGDQLFIDNNKPVEVLMASAGVDDSYSLYQLGQGMNSWQLKSTGFKVMSPVAKTKKKQLVDAKVALIPVKGHANFFKKELCFKMEANPILFPEMAAYKDVIWVYSGKGIKSVGEKLLRDLSNPYGSRRRGNLYFNYWDDVKVVRNEAGQHHLIFSTATNEKLEIAVEPEHIYGYRLNFDSMYGEYTQLVGDKKIKEDDKLVEEVETTIELPELANGFTNMVRFVVDECGTWGINRKVSYQYSLNTSITFTDDAGNILNIAKLYQYEPALNTYQQIDLGSISSMWYNNTAHNVIFAVTGSNEIAILNKKAFAELVAKANTSDNLTAKLTRKPINSVSDVVALFNS